MTVGSQEFIDMRDAFERHYPKIPGTRNARMDREKDDPKSAIHYYENGVAEATH